MTFLLGRSQPIGLTDFKNFWQVASLGTLGLLKGRFLGWDDF